MTGTPIKLYLDEHVWRELTQRLRDQGYDALHVYDVDRGGLSDEAQLEFAAQQGRAVLTYNAKDFLPLAECGMKPDAIMLASSSRMRFDRENFGVEC